MVEKLNLRGRRYLITRGADGMMAERVPAVVCLVCGEWVRDEQHHMIAHASTHPKKRNVVRRLLSGAYRALSNRRLREEARKGEE